MTNSNRENSAIEIDLHVFFKIIKAEIIVIGLSIFLGAVLGSLYAFTFNSNPEYTATGKILPEVASKPTNGLGGLFEILKQYGGNIDMYNTEITRPDIYEEIINTSKFYTYLLSKSVGTSNNKKLPFEQYYLTNFSHKNKIGDQEKVDSASSNTIFHYNYQQTIQKRIVINSSKKNSLVSISVKMPDPVVAADIANLTIQYLIDFITKYRTEKARQELAFVENLIKNNQKDNFSKEIHESLMASELQMKIKIQEDTPIIQVLEYAQIPVIKTNPSHLLIILPFIFIGLLLGILVAIFKNNEYHIITR
ncbi:Wzz/FepE/Etk N-terminal domain-containing protein [Arundinibacter roseus]|uniref:Polysaccharide chain length determinant N-terminal domain-containing protein n=1 Tax=Arundinibacter roseus TaxID=2070510 RepID=A0A4R4KKH2_9BACT|nr:Wzz/FepE/Etk N-terminal domain-containing protein [Arundinibacter roseus]TDB67452.1 hypothetical protein EZE20_05760 [Arundinibacter roseus]